jgi:3',5'-cyclic AMP phosphodiesterase CpdA
LARASKTIWETEIPITPVLQIIHVSDLHFCSVRSDKAALTRDERWVGLLFQRLIERKNAFGWHEGTLEHDATAVRAFEDFLLDLQANDPVWFGRADAPPTWLIDSGDATTFGDEASMVQAHRCLERWQKLLGAAAVRSIYGNHDAWPGAHPAMYSGPGYTEKIEYQRNQINQFPSWQEHHWQSPLCVDTPSGLRVEAYATDTVLFGLWNNVRALGRVPEQKLDALRALVSARHEPSRRALRVLVTHHPVAYPYASTDMRQFLLVKQMVLENADLVTQCLSNDRAALSDAGLVPLIHLFLSGHTHLAMPGQALPRNVKEVSQGQLGGRQMQLVGGPLLLVRDRKRVRDGLGLQPVLKDRKDFSQPWVFEANQQFQILRFHHDSTNPDGLWLERIVCARSPNSKGYRSLPELRSTTFMEIAPITV